jgi:hypothetical protein
MLVRFDSDQGSISMFRDAAVTLLKMMGQSGAIPGAVLGKDVAAALERLKRAMVAQRGDSQAKSGEDESGEPRVSLQQRAFPLIELLTRAAAEESDVIWEDAQAPRR